MTLFCDVIVYYTRATQLHKLQGEWKCIHKSQKLVWTRAWTWVSSACSKPKKVMCRNYNVLNHQV
jgi:hypothetical protein